ncbi:MAG: hypothetical protein FD135_1761 [Comamonadaceae bacterium]|nr:MAG: hypothetical protein FD135_1761 [Comamonadaceae bacterium]
MSANVGGSFPIINEVHRQASIDVSSESWLTPLFPLHAAGDFCWSGVTVSSIGLMLGNTGEWRQRL